MNMFMRMILGPASFPRKRSQTPNPQLEMETVVIKRPGETDLIKIRAKAPATSAKIR
jgi:hypothetical protein